MSDEDLATVARIYEGWEGGDFTFGVAAFDPDATLVVDPGIPDGGVFEGLDGIRTYMTRFLEAWESLTIAAKSFKQSGDAILVAVRQTGVGKESGVPVTLEYFQVWTFRDGSVIRLESILREEKALAAIDS